MDKKTAGAWIVHHGNKLQQMSSQQDFENLHLAGRAGVLLSALSASDQHSLDHGKVEALAKANNINRKTELPMLLELFKKQNLIAPGKTGIEILGITNAATLAHTTDIFKILNPTNQEIATVELADIVSDKPRPRKELGQQIADTYKIAKPAMDELLDQSEAMGFVDHEALDSETKIYFNGNLFRKDHIRRTVLILDGLKPEERANVTELNTKLQNNVALTLSQAERILGAELFKKLQSVGLYDVSIVSNSAEEVGYVTRPAAFGKYGNPFEEDALDLAKALVSSLTYGMTKSSAARGRITMIDKLMRALFSGRWIGPVAAIGEDYKVLEMKRVVEVKQAPYGQTGYLMRLIKKDVGELAYHALNTGSASEHSLEMIPSSSVTKYSGPEENRTLTRRKQRPESKRGTKDILDKLRM